MSPLKRVLETMGGLIRYIGILLVILGVVAWVAPLTSGLAIAVIIGHLRHLRMN